MKRRTGYRSARGQATMEIAIALVAIVFLVAGFFTLGGIGITSIKSLILTRYHAEKNAETKVFGSSSTSRQIRLWGHSTVVQKRVDGDRKIVIPFLADDESMTVREDLGSDYLQAVSPSLSVQPDRATAEVEADYLWQSFDPVVSRRIWWYNTAILASLHLQAPVLETSEQIYLLREMKNKEAFKQNLHQGGWFNVQNIDITKWESSVVAFPAFAPQK